MENNENKKPSAENAGEKKPNHKRHHHNRNRHHKPNRPEEAAAQVKAPVEAPAAEAAPKEPAGNNQPHRNNNNKNKNKKNHQQPKSRPEAEVKPIAEEPAVNEQNDKSKNRRNGKDRPKRNENAQLLTSLPENDLDFLPSRSKSESDFLSLGKTDDAYLDKMPIDPTLDAVFADVPVEEPKEIEGPEIVGIRFEHGSKVYYFRSQRSGIPRRHSRYR